MSELKFTNEHECVKAEGDIAWIGITKYAQDALGDLVYVELPKVGDTVKKGEEFAVVESVKTAAEVYSPVDGEVVEANEGLSDDLEMISAPVGEGGWIAKIKMDDSSQLEDLMDRKEYDDYTEGLE